MKVKEALKILEKLNPDLGLFICLNINTDSFMQGMNISKQKIITIDSFIDCSCFIGIVPSTNLEIGCPT